MKPAHKITMTVCVTLIFVLSAEAVQISVPGTSDPWLAGMPNGSVASWYDSAPAQSPVQVGITIIPGTSYVFSASGLVDHGLTPPEFNGPDGDLISPVQTHWPGAENGIANLNAPYNSLVGIFLGSNQPSLSAAPATLSFGTAESRNYETLSPLLKQPFFIGDGRTDSAIQQSVIAPPGATRLYLGTMDIYEWSNNTGSFSVEVAPVPEPATLFLIALGAAIATRRQRRK